MTRLFVFILMLLASSNFTQAQEQITHLIQKEGDYSSNPSYFIEFNGQLVFLATTESEGRELWITDGLNNTFLLKDIYIGNNSGPLSSFVILNELLYFIANDESNGRQIWSTDGTTEGTKKVTTLANSNISKLTLVNNQIFFLNLDNNIIQVWKSDGTNQGTVLVKDNMPVWNSPSFEGTANNLFFFTIQDQNTNDTRVWRSDGTATGTFAVSNKFDSGTKDYGVSYFVFNNELYFVARSQDEFTYPLTYGIFKSDGTVENTIGIKGVHAGNNEFLDYSNIIEVNNKLYFSFFIKNTSQLFIWESDGTELGTRKIYDKISPNYFNPSNLSSNGTDLIFIGPNDNGNSSLLKLNITNYNIEEISELPTGSLQPYYPMLVTLSVINKINNSNFQISIVTDQGLEAWQSDLTTVNTKRLVGLDRLRSFINYNNTLYFAGKTELEGNELWQSDLEFENIELFENINTSAYGIDNDKNEESIVNGSKIYYVGDDGTNGKELWVYDNQTNNTIKLNSAEGISYSSPEHLKVLNGEVYFISNVSGYGTKVLRTNGTNSGTIVTDNLNEQLSVRTWMGMSVYKNNLYYFVFSEDTGEYHLVKYDGNNLEIFDGLGIASHGQAYYPLSFVATEKYIYFIVATEGYDLWRSDGTNEGTVKIKDLYNIEQLTAVGENVFFSAQDEQFADTELWQSDGTEEGTKMTLDINVGLPSDPQGLFNFENKLVFSAVTAEFGRELWISDGTPNGTNQIIDINPGVKSAIEETNNSINYDSDYTVLNGVLYFSATNGINGHELWRTDSTTNGTSLVLDINEGVESSNPAHFENDGERLYFSAFSAQNGHEIWSSAGQQSNTSQLFNLIDGPKSSNPSNFMFIDETLFFRASTNTEGMQFWRYNHSTLNLPVDNFAILTTSATCVSKNNGSIEITAKELLDYSVTLTGENLSQTKEFNKTILFSDLAAGAYDLCISVYGGNYVKTCFVLQITEPEVLSVSSKINSSDNTINLNLSGSNDYFISLNDEVYHTSNNEITLALSENSNKLSVVTDKTCQGTFEKNIILSPTPLIYPNPINDGDLHITIGETETDYLTLSLYTLNGKMIMSEPSKVDNKEVIFNVDGLKKGIYLLTLKARQIVIVHKLIKN